MSGAESREQTVRRLLAARETNNVDAALACLTDDVVIDASRRQIDPVVLHGHDGCRTFWAMLDETWSRQRVEPKEFTEVGDSLVVAVDIASVGRNSRLSVQANSAWVATFQNEKIARLSVHQSKEDALAALGAPG